VLHRIADREIGREGVSGDIHIAVGIKGNTVGAFAGISEALALEYALTTSEVGRPDQLRSIRIEFRNECFIAVGILARLIRVLDWERF
jgi:hypothetical protein